jgi:hypothetical protein
MTEMKIMKQYIALKSSVVLSLIRPSRTNLKKFMSKKLPIKMDQKKFMA